ncbi:ferrous iron transport protein B [Candidatus Woesearchaeota archaeon]|nr:ferrous iron transport protein B [Candidatus Woesearchaeota archaeon]
MKKKIALAGNPNVGKSTLFNTLTGTRQHVGNWPGKTVEKKSGRIDYKGKKIDLVDLPGTYSLTAYSEEEIIARNYIVENEPDLVVQILDATNLERNLYLTTQLIELGCNVILAVNFVKEAKKKGIIIDKKKLSELLDVPVVMIEANEMENIVDLMHMVNKRLKNKKIPRKISYGKEIDEHVCDVREKICEYIPAENPDWTAIKLLENDDEVIRQNKNRKGFMELWDFVSKQRMHLEKVFGEDIITIIAKARYGFIEGLTNEVISKQEKEAKTLSEKIDYLATHKYFGIPLFLLFMFITFYVSFFLAAPLTDGFEFIVGFLQEQASFLLNSLNASSWIVSLVSEAVIGGVGSVLVFVPNIFVLFFFISFMEDSGYMARAAYVMDRLMHKIGLHGKSFIPMILGFGCNVPAIMATRSLDSKKDRILTILINPFMSCSARLPVYVLFAGAFFPKSQAVVIFLIYLLGIAVAVISGFVFHKILFKGISTPLVMELPPYRMPTLTGLLIHMWERGKSFIRKAGTIIFLIVVVIWFLANIPYGVEYASRQSLIGWIGDMISPVFEPLGFGNWQSSVALIFGVVAKEVVIGTFGTVFDVGEQGLSAVLQNMFTPLSAAAFMVFVLLYIPCISTIATIKKETGSWRWTFFVLGYTTIVAWLFSFIVYQGGLLLGFV